jgi:hypothetical protein
VASLDLVIVEPGRRRRRLRHFNDVLTKLPDFTVRLRPHASNGYANNVWDLLVVVSDDTTDDELDIMQAWQAVRDLRIPADVIPVRRSEFEEARDHAGTLVRTVVGESMQIYAR